MNSVESNSKKFKEQRAYRIAFLEQQLVIFKADLLRFKKQIEEVKKLG